MMKFRFLATVILIMHALGCRAKVVFNPVVIDPELQRDVESSAYAAIFHALRFVSRTKDLPPDADVVKDFSEKWINPLYAPEGGKTTKKLFDETFLAWQARVLDSNKTWLSHDVIVKSIFGFDNGNLQTFHNDLLLQVFGHIDEFMSIKHTLKVGNAKAKIDAVAAPRVGWIINASPDSAKPHWVAVGIFKVSKPVDEAAQAVPDKIEKGSHDVPEEKDVDYHVCTMNSVAGVDVFADGSEGNPASVKYALRELLTGRAPDGSQPVASLVPSPATGSPTGSHDSLEGFGGVGVGNGGAQSGDESGDDPELKAILAQIEASERRSEGTPEDVITVVTSGSSGSEGASPIFDLEDLDEEGFPKLKFAPQEPVAEVPARGLVNQGATCYQNSLQQAINKNPPLKALLQAGYERQRALLAEQPASSYIRKFFEIQELLDVREPGIIDPKPFCLGVRNTWGEYRFTAQQDAVEFLQRLVAGFQAQGIVPGAGSQERFDDGFHGVAEQDRMMCVLCAAIDAPARFSPEQPDHTFLFSLALPPAGGDVVPVDELFRHYSRRELLENDERVDCPTCGNRTDHSKQKFFRIHPEQQFLVLQINRFRFHPVTMTPIKLVPGVTFPPGGEFIIKDSTEVEHRFRVTSVVVQSGSLSSGHYWAVTREGVFNDRSVTLDGGAGMEALLATGLHEVGGWHNGTGYLYFLERVHAGADEEKPGAAGGEVAAADDDEDED